MSTQGLPSPDRRRFLIAAGAAGAAFGFAATAEAAISLGPYSGASAFEPSLWYAIDAQGTVTVNVVRAEMGQHVGTALARIVADDVEVARIESGDLIATPGLDWARVMSLSDVVGGRQPGRTAADEITLFESQGLGLEDLAVAAVLLEQAAKRGIGIEIPLQ